MFEEFVTTMFVVAGVIYALVQTVKPIYDPEKRENLGDTIAGVLFGVGICVMASIDVFPVIGVPFQVPYVGAVMTGILMGAGGAAALHDIIALARPAGA